MTDTNTAEREAIIRAAVAAMPHTNPLVADDLLGGFTMHTEADDIVAIFQAGRASLAASAGGEPVAADGSFLLLPARPKPEAPANTVGLDWDAYSGAQMLAYGRSCSDAALAAAQQTPVAQAPWGAYVGGRVWVGKLPAHVPKLSEAEGLPIQWLYTHPSPPEGSASAAPPMDGEIALIEKAVKRVGIKSLLNHGAGSLVYSEGVEGVTQDDLLAYTREIALHCAVALGSPPEGMAGWTKASEQLPPCRDNQLYIGVNSAGFAGVFNAVTSIAGNVYCHYETAEESNDVLGDLAIWKQFNPPLPASEAKEL